MLGGIFRKFRGRGPEGNGARLVRRMGGDLSRLTGAEKHRLEKTTDAMPLGTDVNALLNHVQAHGSSVLREQMDLLDKAGAFEQTRAQMDARQAAYDALWASDVPTPTLAQLDLLEGLPSAGLRRFVSSQCRTGLVFDPVIRPTTAQDLSFAGGLPMVSSGLQWPMKTRKDGSVVPCPFLGQIDCASLPDFALRALFPKEGALVFFLGTGKTSAPLVQHCGLERPKEVAPPPGLETQSSHYDPTLYGEIQTGWPGEEPLGLPRHSLFPKFPLAARLLCQAPLHSWFAEQPVEVPHDLLAPFEGSTHAYLLDLFDALNVAGGSLGRARDEGQFDSRGVADFPQVWGSVARMLERFDLSMQQTERFYEDRIAANETLVEKPSMAAAWVQEGAEARAAEVARSETLLDQLRATRAIVSDWIEKAQAAGRGTDVPEQERRAFWHLWETMLADQDHFRLEDRWNPSGAMNAGYVLDNLIRQEATLAAIACLSGQGGELSQEGADWMRPYLQSLHGANRYAHVQSLGHATSDNSEAPFVDILLMQFPNSRLFDWYFGDAGAVQFWLSQHDFQTGAFEKAMIEET